MDAEDIVTWKAEVESVPSNRLTGWYPHQYLHVLNPFYTSVVFELNEEHGV